MSVRLLEKFTSVDGSLEFLFPRELAEWESSQTLRIPRGQGVGAEGSHDFLGYAPAPRNDRMERWRCMAKAASPAALEVLLDNARATCWRIGLGYLYRLDSDGTTRRRSLARVTEMPAYTINGKTQFGISPLIIGFLAEPSWKATSAVTGSVTVNGTPENFTINNPGTLPAYPILRARSNAGAGSMTNMALVNDTNGYSFSTTRDFSNAAHELRVNAKTGAVEYSTDDGATYANDYPLFTWGAQDALMRVEPGDNDFTATDGATPNYALEWEFEALYA